MRKDNKSSAPSAFSDTLRWGMSVIVYSTVGFIINLMVFSPLLGIITILGLPKMLFWFGIIGFVAVGVKNYHGIKPDDMKKTIEDIGYKLLIFSSIFANYVSFAMLIIVSLYVSSISSLGLLIPLFWLMTEREVAKRAWYLSPSLIVFISVIWIVKRYKVPDVILPDVSRIAVDRISG